MEIKNIKVDKSPFKRWMDKAVLFIFARLFALIIATIMGLKRKERMSHNNGIGAKGRLYVKPDPKLPPNDFFVEGREFPIRIRHAAATFYDDAMAALRSISIKLSDDTLESPFDMNLNTGKHSLFWNAASFMRLAAMRKQRYGVEYQYWYRYYPDGRSGAIGTLRRHLESYADQVYYSKTPTQWISTDGKKHYVKYRVVPFNNIPETGQVFGDDLIEPENQRILPGEKRSRNYLKDEYYDRLNRGEIIKYRLQAQVRPVREEDDWFLVSNNMIDWPEEEYPWLQVAEFEISDPLSWDESNMIAFSLANLPPSLAIFPAKSIYDPHSLNYFRVKAEIARKARWFAYKWRGMPPKIPYDDYRNSSTILESHNKMKTGKFPTWEQHR